MVSMPVAALPTMRLSTGVPAASTAAFGVVVSMIALAPRDGTVPVSQLVAVNQSLEVAPVQLVSAANAGTQIAAPASAVVQNSAARRAFPAIFPNNANFPQRHPLPHVMTGRRCPEGTAVEF